MVVKATDDPWFDLWYARLVNAHGRALRTWRVPPWPPYTLRYNADVRVVLGRIEFLNHDLDVLATWTRCRDVEVLGGGHYTITIDSYTMDRA